MSEYAFALDDTHYIFRLRTGKGEAESVRFYYADRAVMTPKLQFAPLPMEKFRTDRYFDWYEIRLETRFERIAYYFELQNGVETLFYYGDCYEMAGTPTRADYFQLPFNHRADRFAAPAWTRDAVVYNIFPDSDYADRKNNYAKMNISSHFSGGFSVVGRMLDDMPDAIETINDEVAMGILSGLKARGVRVPEDVWLAGYDDTQYVSMLETPLTTIRQPVYDMAEKTVSVLLDRIRDPDAPMRIHYIDPILKLRSTSM